MPGDLLGQWTVRKQITDDEVSAKVAGGHATVVQTTM